MGQLRARIKKTLDMLRREAILSDTGFLRLLWKTGYFCVKTGLGPRYYVVAGMARETFPQTDQWLHISAREYHEALAVLNPPAYRKLTQNKLCEKALYSLMHIPTARMRGYYHPDKGITDYGQSLKNEEQLDGFLGTLKDHEVCLKPIEGWGGVGVKVGKVAIRNGQAVLQLAGSDTVLDAGAIIDAYRTSAEPAEFIIEDRLRQSGQFDRFNPASLNTFRLWVLRNADNRISVLGGYLRVGRAGSVIDNASAGGLMCPVDVETGTLSYGITKHSPHRDDFSAHPDHGAQLQGEVIDQWPEICRFACDVLSRLPHTRFAGLDIAVTPDGPVLVETNPEPDKDGAAHANIPSVRLKEAAAALKQ